MRLTLEHIRKTCQKNMKELLDNFRLVSEVEEEQELEMEWSYLR